MLAATAVFIAALVTAAPAAAQDAAPQSPQPAPPRGAGAPNTTQTVDVTRGTRLTLDNFAGEVVVRTWDRDAVKVDARHRRNTKVSVNRTADNLLTIEASPDRAVSGSVDYELTVPAWMPVRLTGTFLNASIEGVQAEIDVETVQGDVTVRGGAGSISLKSIEGEVSLDGAKGRVELHSAEGGVSVTNCSGEITAETLEGTVLLTRNTATVVDASTLDGDIVYDGAFAAEGQYQFTTHDGSVMLRIPETTNALVTMRTYGGSFESSYPVQLSGEYKRGKRVTFTLGKGGADVQIEAFEGHVRLLKPGEALPQEKGKDKQKSKDEPKNERL